MAQMSFEFQGMLGFGLDASPGRDSTPPFDLCFTAIGSYCLKMMLASSAQSMKSRSLKPESGLSFMTRKKG